MIFAQIFTIIQFLLELFGLWKDFVNFTDAWKMKEAEARRERRHKAQEDMKNAQTEEEFKDAQRRLVANSN